MDFCRVFKFYCRCIENNIPIRGKLGKWLSIIVAWIFGVNLLLIIIVNPGVVNPGPVIAGPGSNLKVYFHNVHGLIPFGELKNDHPALDNTKCLELSTYLKESNYVI